MKLLITALCVMSTATLAQADWKLNQNQSDFSFASIKKNNVYESHTFKHYKGAIDDAGNAGLEIDLSSVSTAIEIRDERMKTILFNTPKFPTANYQVSIDPASLTSLKTGEKLTINTKGTLSLFGKQKALEASLNVFKLNDKRILVTTAKPALVKAADFSLDTGIETLRQVASLTVISHTVPVSFSLIFDKN
jgi:polyisoprenoid-binding protein YceI